MVVSLMRRPARMKKDDPLTDHKWAGIEEGQPGPGRRSFFEYTTTGERGWESVWTQARQAIRRLVDGTFVCDQ